MKKKLFLDCMNEPALITATNRSVKVVFQYEEIGIPALTKAIEKALNEIGFSSVEEWNEVKKGGVK